MKKHLRLTALAAALTATASMANAELILTLVMDGDLTGGQPKVVEIKNVTGGSVALADYGIVIFSNGSTSPLSGFPKMLDAVQANLPAGEFLVLHDTSQFSTVYSSVPSNVTDSDQNMSFNGNDVVMLFHDDNDDDDYTSADDTIIDVFGEVGSSTNFYVDSAAVRTGDGANTTWDAAAQADWSINSVDGFNAAQHAAAAPLGTNTSLPVELDSFVIE